MDSGRQHLVRCGGDAAANRAYSGGVSRFAERWNITAPER